RSRRGSGVFVCALPTEYPIGTRVRFHENLLAAGRTPDKRVLMIDLRAPSPGEAEILPGATRVCAYHGLSLADGQPIAVFESIFPLNWLPGIDAALGETASVTEALRTVGIADYTRHSTRLTAVQADATQAAQLFIREGAPLLRSTSLNVDSEGRPIEFGRTFFVGDRVTLTLDGE
ncbi:MAG: UTRA domain-containing protein, partial [Pseudomonadota bacterium]